MRGKGPARGEGEFELIRRIVARSREALPATDRSPVTVGPGDDAAVLEGEWVISTDRMVEGVHFRRQWISDPELGGRAVRAALSDLAAMAADPVGVLVSVALPGPDAASRIEALMDGATTAAAEYEARILGGDLSRMPDGGSGVVDVVVVGRSRRPLLRSGARIGDELWVTGALGGSAAAVAAWESGDQPHALAREAFARPVPRTREAKWLSARVELHAGIDLSDGLLADAGHLARASTVGVVIDLASLPRHPALDGVPTAESDLRSTSGGDDYELLFAAAPNSVDSLVEPFADEFSTRLTHVGNVEAGAGVTIRTRDGQRSEAHMHLGYDHFPSTSP